MSLLNGWFGSNEGPIGIDLGTEALKLAQVSRPAAKNGARALIAASCTPLPEHCRGDLESRVAFFRDNIRALLSSGGFRGRRAVLALPASSMQVRRLRLPKMDEAQTKASVLWEMRAKLPFDPAQAMLRHVNAGEIYRGTDALNEVIVMAAPKDLMARFLSAAAQAKLDVTGMAAEPQAVAEAVAHATRGTNSAGATQMVIDIGSTATRVYIARGPQLMFARVVPVGAQDLDRAVAAALRVRPEVARARRHAPDAAATAATAAAAAAAAGNGSSYALVKRGGAATSAAAERAWDTTAGAAAVATAVATPSAAHERAGAGAAATEPPTPDAACQLVVQRLIEELERCMQYHESLFAAAPVEHVLFIGGEASNRRLCRQIASRLHLPANLADPIAPLLSGAADDAGACAQPRSAFAVAIGLSLGAAV
jgi:type IV pilus assembly protein PilM